MVKIPNTEDNAGSTVACRILAMAVAGNGRGGCRADTRSPLDRIRRGAIDLISIVEYCSSCHGGPADALLAVE